MATISDKYQVLASVDGKTSLVIELGGNGDSKPKWKVVVPDAGTPSTAAKIARLFNQEEDQLAERQRNRVSPSE